MNQLRRLALALAVGAALVLTTGLPASAQYGGGGGGTTTTTTTTTTTAPEGGEPAQPRTIANLSDDDVSPGDEVTVTAPAVFAQGSPITVHLARAQQGAGGVELASGNAGANGAVSETVTVPATQPGVYFIYVPGVDSDGNPVVALAPIVIRGDTTAAAIEGEAFAAAAVPAAIADVQSSLTPASEAAVVEAVTQSGAGLVLSPEGTLNVSTPEGVQSASALPTTGGNDISTQVAVGAALLLAGTGMVLLRRRGGFVK